MKPILFIGACEKADLLLYISKLLTTADQKVLLVDGTLTQRYGYSISQIDEQDRLTEFDGFDVALGFSNLDELQIYFDEKSENLTAYDFILIDSDDEENVKSWGVLDQQVAVTSFERFSVLQNVKLMEKFLEDQNRQENKTFLRVYYPFADCKFDETYIDSTIEHLPIRWHDPAIDFQFDEVDYATRIENQYENRLQMRGLSGQYKRQLLITCEILSGLDQKTLKAALKVAEKGR
ncbi:hypothetical protein [Paenibacillus chitinolyticus]|uniref:hypothetical protein n=1 Tax=Paenibacillus chitinolyticus TaxID=79263 RepID=UPI001C437F9B|nr:hypothetical protein [Paenibacillus chitinolyticus]MBV6717209.1 hypothetical protein [Paenibacillus chitinolyticus]